MSYYGALVTRTEEDRGKAMEEEEDIFVEMRHAIQVRIEALHNLTQNDVDRRWQRQSAFCVILYCHKGSH